VPVPVSECGRQRMPRVIPFEGSLNFRDLGGYATADGRAVRPALVYRSDALHHLTAADVVRLRRDLRVETVIDLRSTAERRAAGQGLLGAEAIRLHHVPLFDGESARAESWSAVETLADRYFLLAEFAREPIARIVGVLAEASGPLVYQCAAGKDRTGVVSAVILGLLGVPDESIVADYVATQENLDAIVDRLMSTAGYRAMLAALPADTMHARPETMVRFLERIRAEHGSMRSYARAAGVPDGVIERLAMRLLDG
jgi:protein-tyrosine phosphatase